ncbi:MAG: crosslink repair DNA glycosylase YcaQ family protein [Candidatus Limnocylindria bacterium]|nr:crosslink repair DNA glycosylase YcaQ family protein [Candidatus Limnocylindria bacterium]
MKTTPAAKSAARTAPLKDALEAHRAKLERAYRVRNAAQLVEMVDALGFCFAFTGQSAYPVPACFDHLSTNDDGKKWEWMWPWKDELAEAKKLYYGKLLVKKPTFVSMKMLPVFYATFGRAGEADDHLEDVRAGRLTDLARRIVEYLAHRGETQKKRMRADLGIESKEGRGDLERAIEELQRLMYVARVKAVGERSDDYNYTYDLFVRRYPETVKAAERLSSADATPMLLQRLLELAGGVTEKQVSRLFDWESDRTARAVDALESTGGVRRVDTLLVLPRYDTQA